MNILSQLLFNPAILSLAIGCIIGFGNLFTIPKKLATAVAMYLIFCIGFKGGACIGVANQCTPPLLMLTGIGILIGFIQPFIHYFLLKKTTSMDLKTAIVVAAEYGSISIVTFITAISFLNQNRIPHDTFMTAIAGIMEIPAILSGLILIRNYKISQLEDAPFSSFSMLKAIFACKQVSVIFLGFFAGAFCKNYLSETISEIILYPFTFTLILCLVDVGIKIAKQQSSISQFKLPVIAFALSMPLINGVLAILIGSYFVNNTGSLLLFAILSASASYIAVPAVMRTEVPEAIEAVYLPLSLGITLPFNVIIGIPFFYFVSKYITSIS